MRTSLGPYPPAYGAGQYPPSYFAPIAADFAIKLATFHQGGEKTHAEKPKKKSGKKKKKSTKKK